MVSIDADASLSELKTGDLVLFTGQGLARGLAQWFNRSPGRTSAWCCAGPRTPSPCCGRRCAAGRAGARSRRRLSVRMARSRGRISARCLNRPLAAAQCQRLEALRQEVAERARPRGLLDLIGAADDGWVGGQARQSRRADGRRAGGRSLPAHRPAGRHRPRRQGAGRLPAVAFLRAPWSRAEERLRPRPGAASCAMPSRAVGWSGISPQPA